MLLSQKHSTENGQFRVVVLRLAWARARGEGARAHLYVAVCGESLLRRRRQVEVTVDTYGVLVSRSRMNSDAPVGVHPSKNPSASSVRLECH